MIEFPALKHLHINLLDTQNLTYEILDMSNYMQIYHMFKDDSNPFIIDYYKNEQLLDREIRVLENYCKVSIKSGACSWLFKIKAINEYAGVVDIYNLCQEENRNLNCTIGFSTKACFRQKKYTIEAVDRLLKHAQNHYQRNVINANTHIQNIPSQNLLKKLGFELISESSTNELLNFRLNLLKS